MPGRCHGPKTAFESLAIPTADQLVFGRAPRPLACGDGLTIGGGHVYPEINFTLPPMLVTAGTWPQVRHIYETAIDNLLERARRLALPGLVVEFEQLPPMTAHAAWGAELTEVIKTRLRRARQEWRLASALRVTIVDLRDQTRPPQRRVGPAWESMHQSLKLCSRAGADILSIESTGGKEVHDVALMRADVPGIVLALGILAPRDMVWLWDRFVEVAGEYGNVAGGDSACGFANTAMQLAEKRMLPEVLAAFDRAIASVRSLVAFECGALGPSKDCAYEGPVLKAITGCPISMEGRSATCAHLSPIGNIAAAAADLWSNESVADVPLLSGPAPVACLESLAYDCRLLNAALDRGTHLELRDLHVASDAPFSPQAAILTPEATLLLARGIVAQRDPYRRTVAAAQVALDYLQRQVAEGLLRIEPRELRWLDRLRRAVDQLPDEADELIALTRDRFGELYDSREYE